jgi:hypothetical protein
MSARTASGSETPTYSSSASGVRSDSRRAISLNAPSICVLSRCWKIASLGRYRSEPPHRMLDLGPALGRHIGLGERLPDLVQEQLHERAGH